MPEKQELSQTINSKEQEFQHLTSEIGHLAIKHYQDRSPATEDLMQKKIESALEIETEIQNLNQKAGLE
ncbi:MAG: hypothetical protein ACOCXH_14615 [Cyclobacteriaceae bacterium]